MTDQAPARPGRPLEQHRYECRTCQVRMSTDNPVVALIAVWKAEHAGHDLVADHDVEHFEPCTGITASWCPNCGDCTCPVEVDGAGSVSVQFDDGHADPRCPLHGLVSAHA